MLFCCYIMLHVTMRRRGSNARGTCRLPNEATCVHLNAVERQ